MTHELKPSIPTVGAPDTQSATPDIPPVAPEMSSPSAFATMMERAVDAHWELPMTTVVFDLETSGLSPVWDQILQCAALRVDSDDLTPSPEPSETLNLRCRLKAEVVPSPAALLTTRVWPHMLDDAPLSHDEMMRRISDFLTESRPAVFVGHNAIRFDSPHLRHNLFSALLPPYVLQMDGSRISDTMLLCHLVHALDPAAMDWPRKPDGKLSFRLGDLCAANGIALDPVKAHDALADVTATLDLYALIRARSPKVFALGHALATKRFVCDLAESHAILGIIRVTGTGAAVTPVTTLPCLEGSLRSSHKHSGSLRMPGNPNAIVALDLRVDPAGYIDLEPIELRTLIAGKSSPVKAIRTNAMPLVIPFEITDPETPDVVREFCMEDPALPVAACNAELQRRADILRGNAAFAERLRSALAQIEEERPVGMNIEEQLYAGRFAPDADFTEGRRFLEMQPEKRHLWLDRIKDYRLNIHAQRLVHATAPETLETDPRALLDRRLHERLTTTDADAPWMSIPKALAETEALRQTLIDQADTEANRQFPNPYPTARCSETGVWLDDPQARAEVERIRHDYINVQIGTQISLLDAYHDWLTARLSALQPA